MMGGWGGQGAAAFNSLVIAWDQKQETILKALDQLSALTSRAALQRDVTAPLPIEATTPPPPPQSHSSQRQQGSDSNRSITSLSSTIAHELGIPVRYIGTGEKLDDLAPFDAREFVSSLLN